MKTTLKNLILWRYHLFQEKGKILWNGQLYKISDVMYGFETSEEEYGFIVSPEIQTSIASDLSYKVWLEEVI